MDTTMIAVAVVVLVLIVLAVWAFTRNRRSEEMREHFGPEYERTVQETGDPHKAERELARRQERVEALHIHPLTADEYRRYSQAWQGVQAKFVDDPSGAVKDADRLVNQVMQTRGYPIGDFEQRAADLSVEHPTFVSNYRQAYDIAQANDHGRASTEDLRQAMVNFRELFQDLLQTDETTTEVRQ
ncbi:MAG: hypothetical protein U0822_14165 [Anaerolineae bacterium]